MDSRGVRVKGEGGALKHRKRTFCNSLIQQNDKVEQTKKSITPRPIVLQGTVADYLLPTTYYLLLATCYLLPTTYYLRRLLQQLPLPLLLLPLPPLPLLHSLFHEYKYKEYNPTSRGLGLKTIQSCFTRGKATS